MGKILLGPTTKIYPMPVLLIGANVDGKLDVNKINPLIYMGEPGRQYQALGEVLGKAFRIYREIKGKE